MANGIEFSPSEYMVFEADQVLTKDHLNQLFDYLDQQNRWTRNKLIGIGIVCGLDLVQQPESIEITRGCAVTSQGYLITEDFDKTYLYYIPYTGIDQPSYLPFTYPGNLPFYKPYIGSIGNAISLMLTQDEFDALDADTQKTAQTIASLKLTKLFESYAVVLFLEANELDLKNCDTFDCDNKGRKMTLTIRPLLVNKNDLPALKAIKEKAVTKDLPRKTNTKSGSVSRSSSLSGTTIGSTKGTTSTGFISAGIRSLNTSIKAPQVSLKRFNVPYKDLNTTDDVINAFVNLVDDKTLSDLAGAYNFCYDQYKDLLGDEASGFPTLYDDLRKQRDTILGSFPVFIQYFYDHVDDLLKAYYEFRTKVSLLLSACCPDENLFPLHVVLGASSATTKDFAKDAYRTYFIYSPLFLKQENEVSESVFLFKRMQILSTEFTTVLPGELKPFAIKILPGQYQHAYLSQRVIPYYYRINVPEKELFKYWSYYKTIRGNQAFNLSYNANAYSSDDAVLDPLLYDIERENFFRIEGHIGVNYLTALSDILGQRDEYNLPFDVVAVSADLLPVGSSTGELPDCNIADLDSNYRLLLSEFTCKVQSPFCFITQQEYKPVKTVRGLSALDQGSLTLLERNSATGAVAKETSVPGKDTGSIKELAVNQERSLVSFTQFRQQAFIEQGATDLTLLQDGAQRGDFIKTYCPPAPDTIGSAYLAAIKNGVFTNPVKISTSDPDSIYYHELFDYVDSVESLMMVLMPSTLATIDMDEFMAVYKVFADSLFDVSEAITEIMDETVETKTRIALDAGELEMDLVRDQLAEAVYACIDERIKTLLSEYEARLNAYELQRNFLHYFQKHPGLEHKAGVPKGGTFVLVYHPPAAQTDTGSRSSFSANTLVGSAKESSFTRNTSFSKTSSSSTSDVAKLFLAKNVRITPEKKTTATNIKAASKTTKTTESADIKKRVTPTPDVSAEKAKSTEKIVRATEPEKTVVTPGPTTEPLKVETTVVPGAEKTIVVKETTVPKAEAEVAKAAAKDTATVLVETAAKEAAAKELAAKEAAAKREAETAKTSDVTTAAKEAAAKEAAAKEAAAKRAAEEAAKREAAAGKDTGIKTSTTTGTRTSTTTGTKTSAVPVKTSTGKSLLDENTINLLTNFAAVDPGVSEESKNALFDILTLANDRLAKSQYAVADNVVIADFYVPYLCCSDCAPVVYVFPPKETPPEEEAEFSIASTEYVFDDAHNYPFTADPPVTEANQAQVPFSSAEVLNPGNLNLLTDDANIMYLHPAMPDLAQTTTSVITYKNIPISITIIRPDATFDMDAVQDATGALVLQLVAADPNADTYSWLINDADGLFENAASPTPVSLAFLRDKLGTTSFTVELTVSYTRNGVISEDTKQQFFQGEVCIDFEAPAFELNTVYGPQAGQIEGDVAFATPEKIVVKVQRFIFPREGSSFNLAFIGEDPGVFGSKQCLQVNNILMEFDYSNSSIQPSIVTVDFLDQGGFENFSVNGSDIIAGELTDLPLEIKGVKIAVTVSDGRGTLTMIGAVTVFQIGGQEFAIDNVCAQ